MPGTAGGATLADRRPHRRDRPDRHAHRRRRLPALHRRRRLGPADPRRPAGRASPRATARSRASSAASRSTCSRTTTARRSRELKELHIDIGAKDGDEARALVRVGDVAVIAGEPVELPNDRAVARSMDNRLGCLRRLRGRAARARGRRRARRRRRRRRRAGGDDASAARRRPPTRCAPTSRSWSTSPTPPTRPAIEVKELGAHPFGSGPVIERGSNLHPRRQSSCCYETAEAEDIPFTLSASGRATGTDADAIHTLARRASPTAARVDPAALHALAGGDGPARRRRTTRRSSSPRSPAGCRPTCRSSADAQPVLLLFDIDGTLLIRGAWEHALALHDAIEQVWGVDLREVRVQTGGRTDPDIAREILVRRRRRPRGRRGADGRRSRSTSSPATPSSSRTTCRTASPRARRTCSSCSRPTRRCGSRS